VVRDFRYIRPHLDRIEIRRYALNDRHHLQAMLINALQRTAAISKARDGSRIRRPEKLN